MRELRGILAVATGVVRSVMGTWTGVVFVLALPAFVLVFMGSVVESTEEFEVGVAAPGPLSSYERRLLDDVEADERFLLVPLESPDALRRAVLRHEVDAALLLPAAADDLREVAAARFELVYANARPFPADIRSLLTRHVDEHRSAWIAAVAAADASGAPLDDALAAALAVPPEVRQRGVDVPPGAAGRAAGFEFAGPANVLLFLFLTAVGSALGLVGERFVGLDRRLRTVPLTRTEVLVGRILGRSILGLGQAMLIVVGSAAAFGVTWGPVAGTAAVVGVTAVIAAALGVAIGAAARTPAQVIGIGGPAMVVAAMVGGAVWPIWIVGDGMRRAALAMPHAWAMSAFDELRAPGGGMPDVLQELAVLAAFAVAAVAVAGVAHRADRVAS